MNTNTIRKHYAKLTQRERFAAFVAADLRDDDDEVRALLSGANLNEQCQLEDLRQRFGILAVSIACSQWKETAMILFLETAGGSPEAIAIGAYTFITRAEAWRALCQEYGIDGNALLDKLDCDSYWLDLNERIFREFAFTPEEAAEALTAQGMDASQIMTVDKRLSLLRNAIEGCIGQKVVDTE